MTARDTRKSHARPQPLAHDEMGGKEPERALVNRGDDPYPTDVKAEAVALVYQTGSYSEAARQMSERYRERHPSRQLITRWFRQTDPEAFATLSTERKEAFEIGIMEMASKALEKMFDALDDMQPGQRIVVCGNPIWERVRASWAKTGGAPPGTGSPSPVPYLPFRH